jgi:hypothetical protein
MRRPFTRGATVFFSLLGAGCAAESSTPVGARLDLQVGALSLPDVGRVCYDVRVENGAGGLVWSRGTVGTRANQGDSGALCSDRFGNIGGGDVSYVGPCDASSPQHTVRLWIDSIEDPSGVALTDWRDPCPAGPGDAPGGCAQVVTCAPNADTLVAYDLTVMRRANQGFFDVAVSFDDIFCSAKLDCTYDDAGQDPIRLLHRDGVRSQTAVIGFACTGGPGGAATVLHASDIRVTCGSGSPLQVQVAFGALEDGSVFGFEVHGPGGQPPTILPILWERTGPGQWSVGQALPTGALGSGQLIWRLSADRIAGPNFDTSNPSQPNIAVWSRVGGVWGLERTVPMVPGATDLSQYDAAFDRLWLGDAFAGTFNAYWNITGTNPGVHTIPEAGGESCFVLEADGNTAVAACGGAPHLFHPVTMALTALPLPSGASPGAMLLDAEVLADGAILGLLDESGGDPRTLVRWGFVEGNWSAQAIDSDPGLTFDWSSQGHVSVTDGDGVQTIYRADFSGSVESFSGASLDGNPTHRFQGLVLHGGEAVVMGAAERDGVMVPAVGLLGTPGDEIALTELPLDVPVAGIQAVFAYGLDASGNLLVVGGDPLTLRDLNNVSNVDTALWALSTAGEISVVDHRVLVSGNASLTAYAQQTHLPLRPTPVVAGFVADPSFGLAGYAGAWESFMTGTSSGVSVMPTRLMSPVAGAGTTSLDPTVLGNGWTDDPDPADAVWGYAIYRGTEALQCGLASCDKLYWNAAIGFDTEVRDCAIHFEATAADAPGLTLGQTPATGRYPVVVFDVVLTDDDGMVCRRNGLDDGGGVASTYTAPDAVTTFCYAFDGSQTAVSPQCEADL